MSINGIDKNNLYNTSYSWYGSALPTQKYFGSAPKNYDKTDAFSCNSSEQDVSCVKNALAEVKTQQGFIGKAWDKLKNLTGLGASSNKANKAIDDYESGLISLAEMKNAVDCYAEGQNMVVDVVADIASGILSIGAFALAVPTGGTSLAVGLGLATAISTVTKVGIKAGDAMATGKKYSRKNLLYDSATGAVNGILAPVTNGIGNTVIKTFGKKLGLTIAKDSGLNITSQGFKSVLLNQWANVTGGTFSKRVLALGAGMAVDGAIAGATDNAVRAGLTGENILKAGVEGAVGGLVMAPAIGGGFRLAGKVGQVLSRNVSESQIKDAATRAAVRVTSDSELQDALVRISQEAVIVRTMDDAIPILQRQFASLRDRKNLIVLDVNPQNNNGLPKSNNLISKWYIDANNLSDEQLITVQRREFDTRRVQVQDLNIEWQPKTEGYRKIQGLSEKWKKYEKNNTMTLHEARKIVSICQSLPPQDVPKLYSDETLAKAIAKINLAIKKVQQEGYSYVLVDQLKECISKANGEPITIVIPDDCSLSGASILCDTVKILDLLYKGNNIDSKLEIVLSPMILGDKAQKVISRFSSFNAPIDETYLKRISALRNDGTESFKDAKKAFERIRKLDNLEVKCSDACVKAVHFTETEAFQAIGKENPLLQQRLLYIMQGPIDGNKALFSGFEQCGVMVVTPTDEIILNGRCYAGKIPTNSVGFMEVLGQEHGVLYDNPPDPKKGLFTKGTGTDYKRYCEWEGLNKPTTSTDRIPICVENGEVKIRQN